MSYKREEMQRRLTHPGFLVRMELEEVGMTVSEAAERLGVARPTLSQLVNENKRVSPEMALKLPLLRKRDRTLDEYADPIRPLGGGARPARRPRGSTCRADSRLTEGANT